MNITSTFILFCFCFVLNTAAGASENSETEITSSTMMASTDVSESLQILEQAAKNRKKLIIVSSFPKAMTDVFERQYENLYPDIDVEVIKKKTASGIDYVEKNPADLFWVSAPDAFEVLKGKGLLLSYTPVAKGFPRRINNYPLHDPDGYYSGFSAAGYGVMWNKKYLNQRLISPPRKWLDLARAENFDQISMSSPTRSGTTHLTIEAILQLNGWERGWSIIKSFAGNAKTITQKSSDVPKAVVAGNVGMGVVIDSYGLVELAKGNNIGFVYPPKTVFVSANIGILAKTTQSNEAKRFLEFLMSDLGQELLLDPDVGRLPVLPSTYFSKKIPNDYPQPYRSKPLGSNLAFNVFTSKQRYILINSLFDVMITYEHDRLKRITRLIHQAEKILVDNPTKDLSELTLQLNMARELIFALPINESKSFDPKYTAIFFKNRKKREDKSEGQQRVIEEHWSAQVSKNYSDAEVILKKALEQF